MSHYKLNVNFSEAALRSIYGKGMKLAIVKSVKGNSGVPVIWVSTLPFENNTIEWEEEYQVYASRQEARNGGTISKLSETQGITNLSFDFKDGVFQNAHPDDTVGENEYGIHNAMNEYPSLTFGLSAPVRVNGELQKGKPINAASVLYNNQAAMAPIEKVQVFLANDINDGAVHTGEFSNAIEVIYENNDVEKSIRYDESKGIFVPV